MRLFLIIFFLSSTLVGAQNWKTVPDDFATQCKTSFIDDINRGSIRLQDLPSNSDSYWVVYSDRENNRLKNRANGSNNGSVLVYMEALYVKEVSNNWLHVYGYENEDEKGWIEARYLLLSLYSLKTEGDVSVPRKVIILTSLDNMIQGGIKTGDVLEQKHYYHQPQPKAGTEKGNPNSFTIMFVMKEQDSSVLLSNTDVLNGSIYKNSSKVYGWMPKANITKWNTRVALEPSRSEIAIKEYAGEKLPGYKDLNKLESCIDQKFCDKENRFVEFEIGDIRINQFRYPLVRSIDKNIKEVFITISANKNFEERPITITDCFPYIMNKFNISHQEAIDLLNKTRVTTKAYVALDYNGNGINALEPVILLAEKELRNIEKSLKEMVEYKGSMQDRKRNFEQCLILIHKSILGQNMSASSIENMTLNQFWQKFFGVDYYYKPLRNISFNDIESIPKKDFKQFFNDFAMVAEDFCDKCYNSRRFSLQDSYFYWIPLDDLPGCKIK